MYEQNENVEKIKKMVCEQNENAGRSALHLVPRNRDVEAISHHKGHQPLVCWPTHRGWNAPNSTGKG